MYYSKFTCILLSCLFAIQIQLNSQTEVRIPRSAFKTEKEGFRPAYKHIKKGNRLLDAGKGNLLPAISEYLLAYEYNPACIELNYKIGLCYLQSGQKGKALSYIQTATKETADDLKNAHFALGKAFQYSYEFDKAIEQYNIFLSDMTRRTKRKLGDEVYRRIEECKTAKELVASPKRIIIKNLGEGVNSEYNDYNALVVNDTTMTFSSRRPKNKKDKPSRLDQMYDEDVYNSTLKDKVWQTARYNTDDGVNTKHNDAILWETYDLKKRYVYDGYRHKGDILLSEYDDDDKEWDAPDKFRRNFNSPEQESSVSLTRDEQTMYFTSADDEESFGGKDIFVCSKNSRGKWNSPENLGSIINTELDEDFVMVSADGNTLYFSSNGHNSMGGFDIFKSTKRADGTWSKPENLGYPLNTPDDEVFFRPSESGKKAYLAAKRPDTKGGFDIYEAVFLGAEKPMVLSVDEQLVSFYDNPKLWVLAPGETKVDTTYFLVGRVTDSKKGTPIMAKIDIVDIQASQTIASTISDSTGVYRLVVSKLQNYGVEVKAKDYMLFLDMLALTKPASGNEIKKDFTLVKIAAGVKIVLKNIYFESGKAVLTPESFTELDKVVKFMQETPELKIEISGHTDNVGSAALNTKLSGARAQAVVDYVVSKGVPAERMVSKGYGPTQPIAPNKTAAGKKMNRRVEFKILSTE
jgi:outer membrane protein OmpA-like peptidoglycan-associated protein/tetratricopeptide (TPR) repeat protein